jgi:hypothetical protein
LITAACKKDKEKESGNTDEILIEGFKLWDGSGNAFGHRGTDDNDWTFKNTLSDRELALLDFTTPYTLDNTKEATITAYDDSYLRAIPNPGAYTQYFQITASDSVLLKAVIVNKKMEVLTKKALKLKGWSGFTINYSDTTLYPDKAAFRMYYSLSAENKLNYKVGYGDIKICRSGSSLDDCFK